MSEIAAFVKNYLIERGAEIADHNWRDFDFVSSGVIDSFEILSFLLVINDRYALRIRPEDFVDGNFHLVGGLVNYIESNMEDMA